MVPVQCPVASSVKSTDLHAGLPLKVVQDRDAGQHVACIAHVSIREGVNTGEGGLDVSLCSDCTS